MEVEYVGDSDNEQGMSFKSGRLAQFTRLKRPIQIQATLFTTLFRIGIVDTPS